MLFIVYSVYRVEDSVNASLRVYLWVLVHKLDNVNFICLRSYFLILFITV